MKQDRPEDPIDRREFLIRSAKAGLLVAATGSLAWLLHAPAGPASPSAAQAPAFVIPDYSVAGAAKKMAIVQGQNRVETVNLGLKALGGIETFIKKGDRVLIKVNAAFATPPILSATTNPELLSEVVRLCLASGAASVAVVDNPINNPESCFALTGIGQAARTSGARLVLPKEPLFAEITVPGAKLIKSWPVLAGPLGEANKLIGIAPVKDHNRSGASMSLKNWYGLVGGRRNMFHQDIHTFIMELAMMIKPTLVILDGIFSMMTNGPTGGSLSDLKQTNTMIVSTDHVAADACGAALLGKSIGDLPYIGKAPAAGAGTDDFESLSPVRVTAA